MLTFSLQSGSNGNAIYVEAGDVRLLFDAGISGKQADMRMAARGRDIRDCNAVIISHNHSDHVRCAGIYQRKFGLPVYLTRQTYSASQSYLGKMMDVRHFAPGDQLTFGDTVVHTLPTPHDGLDPVCFVVEHDSRKLGIFTDLGHPFPALISAIAEIDAVYLESNYDHDMLRTGPYPEHLKRRISGKGGHISNLEAAELVDRHGNRKLQWLALAHLSEENNEPELALETHHRFVGASLPLHLASRYEVGEILEVKSR